MKIRLLTALLFAGILMTTSCYYEDGPFISFRSTRNRIANHWTYDVVTRNGFEVTHQFAGQSIHFAKSGAATYYFPDSTLTGDWHLSDDRTTLIVKLNMTNATPAVLNYTITRLKKDEMTMYETYNPVELKFYLKPLE